MHGLPAEKRALIGELVRELRALPWVTAIALGGSYARGSQRADSDIDLGLYYGDAEPPSAADVRRVAARAGDTANPVVTKPHEWATG